jgi:uncharacterized membrane protein YkvA (DUF1232 family)
LNKPAWILAGNSYFRRQAESLEREIHVLYLVLRDRRAPWYGKTIAAGAAGYALSPVTLIPDWVPVIGFMDNLFVLALGMWLVEKLTPETVMCESRRRAAASATEPKVIRPRVARVAVVAVVAIKVIVSLVLTGAALALLRSTPAHGLIPGG